MTARADLWFYNYYNNYKINILLYIIFYTFSRRSSQRGAKTKTEIWHLKYYIFFGNIFGDSLGFHYFELHSKIKYASELKINGIYFVLRSAFVIFAFRFTNQRIWKDRTHDIIHWGRGQFCPPPISCNLTSDRPSTAAREELKTAPCYIRLTPLVAGLFVLCPKRIKTQGTTNTFIENSFFQIKYIFLKL